MSIPIFYWIWVTNPQLIQSMQEGKLPETEALELCHKYVKNKKKYLRRMMIYALIFLISVGVILIGQDLLPNEAYVFIPLLAALFIGALGACFSFNKYSVSGEYVKALQKGYPQIVSSVCPTD